MSPLDGLPPSAPRSPTQESWLRVTLASIGDGVITTDVQGRVTFLNAVAARLTGWTLRAAEGMPLESIFRIVNEDTGAEVENPATRALRDGVVVGLANHTLLIGKDGHERPIDDSAAPIRDEAGDVGGVVLVFRDVTDRRAAERALRESEERFRLLVSGVVDYAIFPLDAQGHVSGWNLGAERIKGYTAVEVLGKHFSIFYPAEEVASGKPQRELAKAAHAGRSEAEGWRLRKDGTRFWANVVITAVHDDKGQLRGFTKVTRDLTARKLAEEHLRSSERRLRLMVEGSGDAIITGDEGGVITGWNPAAAALFGFSEKEAVGQPITQIMPECYRAAHLAGLERLRKTGEARVLGTTLELRGLRKDGGEFPLELSLSAASTDNGRFFTAIVRDLSERRRAEEQRRQAERASARAEDLADLNRRKDEFLAVLSHELRNPLAAIVNSLHVFTLRPMDDPLQLQARAAIERQVANLRSLVNDLLDVARITTGQIHLNREDRDLCTLVRLAVEGAGSFIREGQQSLSMSVRAQPIWAHVDAGRLDQVLVNLLDNAAKYTGTGGHIDVTLAREGKEAIISVRDDGVGISAELLPHVFETFIQAARSLDRCRDGLGLGLAVVKSLVELHGGTVEAHSEGPGCGSEFVVRLPTVEAPRSTRPAAPAGPSEGSRPLRILVVDDNRDAADSTAVVLRLAGHTVHTAYSATAALDAARESPPDAVLLDLGMPEVDGYEAARRFRADPRLCHVKLLAISGYGQSADRDRSAEAGFDAHLVKPVDPAQLHATLQRLCRPSTA